MDLTNGPTSQDKVHLDFQEAAESLQSQKERSLSRDKFDSERQLIFPERAPFQDVSNASSKDSTLSPETKRKGPRCSGCTTCIKRKVKVSLLVSKTRGMNSNICVV
jgi:hypothetical protein